MTVRPRPSLKSIYNKEDLVEWCQHVAELNEECINDTDSFSQAASRLRRLIAMSHGHRDFRSVDQGELIVDIVGAEWAINAFPQVTIGAKHIAALVATKFPDDVLESVRSPWSAWLIELPPGLLFLTRKDLTTEAACRVMVGWNEQQGWVAIGIANGVTMYMKDRMTAKDLVDEQITRDSLQDFCADGMEKQIDSARRAFSVMGRIVVGVALEMNSRQNLYREPSGPAPKWSKRKMGAPPIKCRTYQLRANVTVDCREQVRDFILGKRSSAPNVQHIVRGHWKLQACGPNLSERKPIWIQPYWRGPEGAAIAVRAHALKDEKPVVTS